LDLFIKLRDELQPILQTDFENLPFVHLGNLDHVQMCVEEDIAIGL
jgi:hypothetical protein